MNSEEAKIRMAEGRIYQPGDEGILKEQFVCMEKLYDFNATRPSEQKKRQDMLKDMFAAIGANCYIEPPLHANFGGKHVHFGRNVYANYNLTLVDDGHIYVGDYVMIGPNTLITTVNHPLSPAGRRHLGQARPVAIGRDVWIGGNCTILPGVTIGNNAVIAAGAVVTRDVPDNCVVGGVPARKIKDISDDTEGMET